MKIAIRVDANEIIATGHLMRCTAIAAELKKLKQEVIFILACDQKTKLLEHLDFPFYSLKSHWQHLDQELPELKNLLRKEHCDLLLVDHYHASSFYLASLNALLPTIYIDDLSKEIYYVAMLIGDLYETNINKEGYDPHKTKLCLGFSYVPLREQFKNLDHLKICERSKQILISTGGTDRFNIKSQLIKELLQCNALKDYKLLVIVGALDQNKDQLRQLQDQNLDRIELFENIYNMAELMRSCQIAISAGGTTLYELCASGVPTISFSIADNQVAFAKWLDQKKFVHYVGDVRSDNIISLCVTQAQKMLSNLTDLDVQSEKISNKIDGNGAIRIAKAMLQLKSNEISNS